MSSTEVLFYTVNLQSISTCSHSIHFQSELRVELRCMWDSTSSEIPLPVGDTERPGVR